MDAARPASTKTGATLRPASCSAAPVPKFSWRYLTDRTSMIGWMLGVLAGILLQHFFGVLMASLFVVSFIALLIPLRIYSTRTDLGDASAEKLTVAYRTAVISLWMVCAVALWLTGNPTAWVLAVTIAAFWAAQLITFNRNGTKAAVAVFALCAVPMMGFLIHSSWIEYPFWTAIASSFFAILVVLSIASSVRYSAAIFLDLRKALAEVSGTKTRLEFAIQSAGDGYFEIDLDTMTYTPNPALALALGFQPGPRDMQRLRDGVHPDDQAFVMGMLQKVRAGESSGWKQELRVRLAAGGWRWMQLRAQTVEANAAHGRKLIGTMVDLTAWKTIEEELRAAKEAAEASSRSKSQFLANMSHEIRTPLNGVLGMAQALELRNLDSETRDMVATIRESGASLMAILNDVLDLSKIEAGKLEISIVPGDFVRTMKRTCQLFQGQAEDKGLGLLLRHEPNLPQQLRFDPVRVRQCVSNLLSNAIKFTASGQVEIAISSEEQADGAHLVIVQITDSGIGMSAETVEKLFTAFTQADGATTRKFGGSGLGLAISRQLARMMGGDITVESKEGEGSTFRFTFRAVEAVTAEALADLEIETVEPARRTLRGVRVLLTDDNAINRQVIKLFLAPQGCVIVEAANGKEALEKAASTEFDVVLLDVHMPVMDGKETIQRIRAEPRWAHLPVIALTADAMSGDREKYLALGMTDYVSKPVDQRELIAKLYWVLKLEAPSAPQAMPQTGT